MLQAILLGIVIWLVLDRLFFGQADKSARQAIEILARGLNKKVHFYTMIGEALVHTNDYQKESSDRRERIEELKDIYSTIEAGDKAVIEGVQALAKHFKVKLESFHIPEEKGIKCVKIKK